MNLHSPRQVKDDVFLNHYLLFVFISAFIFFLQNFLSESDFKFGIFIPDVSKMSQTLDYINEGSTDAISSGFFGIYLIYKPAWIIHPAFCIIINLIFIYYSFKLIRDVFVINGHLKSVVYWGLLLNPYLFLAVTGPNKEIPLIFGTLYILKVLILKPRLGLLKACLLLFFMFFIRDGYAVILALSLILFSSSWGSSKRKFLLGILFLSLVAVSIDWVFENLTVFERNVILSQTIGQDQNSSAFIGDFLTSNNGFIASIFKYLIRFIYNSFTLGLYPVIFSTNGSIYLLGMAYWFFGITVALCVITIGYIHFKRIIHNSPSPELFHKITYWSCFVLLAISVSLFIQPRYFMPVLPILFPLFCLASLKIRVKLSLLVLAFVMLWITSYSVLGKPMGMVDFTKSEFLSPSFLIG